MSEVYLIVAARTPIGTGKPDRCAVLPLPPADLAAHALQIVVARSGVDTGLVDRVILGSVTHVGGRAKDRCLERYNRGLKRMRTREEGAMPETERGHSTNEPHRGLPEDTRQHLQAARQAFRESIEVLFPAGFLEKRRTARREALLAVRSLIDHALERMTE